PTKRPTFRPTWPLAGLASRLIPLQNSRVRRVPGAPTTLFGHAIILFMVSNSYFGMLDFFTAIRTRCCAASKRLPLTRRIAIKSPWRAAPSKPQCRPNSFLGGFRTNGPRCLWHYHDWLSPEPLHRTEHCTLAPGLISFQLFGCNSRGIQENATPAADKGVA